VGPPKTGTTSIQDQAKKCVEELKLDNYEMLWTHFENLEEKITNPNLFNFVACFTPEVKNPTNKEVCYPELLEIGLDMAAQGHNIFISSEYFALREIYLEDLANYLTPWEEVKIVIYYRRFYDWLRSGYEQLAKFDKRKLEHYTSKTDARLIVPYIKKRVEEGLNVHGYTLSTMETFQKNFDDVTIVNFHDKSKDLTESFYCDVLSNAKNTCKKVSKKDEVQSNLSSYTDRYLDITLAANNKGLISIQSKNDIDVAEQSIKNFQEEDLNLSYYDFPLKCPTPETMNILLKMSLEMEQNMFPEFFASSLGEAALRDDLEEQSKSKLCDVDTEVVINLTKWKAFFVKLQRNLDLFNEKVFNDEDSS